MPVEFLDDERAESFGRYAGPPTVADLDRWFFLDDNDRVLVDRRRGDHNRLGFALQLVTARFLGGFLPDPLAVPTVVVDFLAGQLGVGDPSCVKRYMERRSTRFEHAAEITAACGYRDFASAEDELVEVLDRHAWLTGEGPRALFDLAVGWLRQQRVLLPGVSRLVRLVARVRDSAAQRLWDTLSGLLTAEQARLLEGLLEVPDGLRVSPLERLRRGPPAVSGKAMVDALDRIGEVAALELGGAGVAAVPGRRLAELARYGMAAKAPELRRRPYSRKLATLLATVVSLEARATDDALELFDVLMTNELIGRAERESSKEKLRRYPRLSRDAAKCAAAVQVLLETLELAGGHVSLERVWEAIEDRVSRAELRAAVANLSEIVAMPDSDADPHGAWRAQLVDRYKLVARFLPRLMATVRFDATAEAASVLDAMRHLPELMATRQTKRVPAGFLDARLVDVEVVPSGWWQPLVFKPGRPEGTVDRNAYVFCVLEQFHARLRRRDIFAPASRRWADPRAQLLVGAGWDAARPAVLADLRLAEQPDGLLQAAAQELDGAWRHVADRITATAGDEMTELRLDADGRLHTSKIKAIPEPPSLVDLRARLAGMLPRVDIGELILEIMHRYPQVVEAFTAVSGGATRLADLHVTIAAALTAHALNVGYTPVISGLPALTRSRISHVDQNYLRAETFAAANVPLIGGQAELGLAQAWGGGLVAAVDGMRFVVPVRTVQARPNPKFFGRRRGATWLDTINDQAVGLGGMVLSGTPRDSLHLIDALYHLDGGRRPEVIVSDTGSYSDMVFGLLRLLGFDYRPQLADLPDTKLWRADRQADYGPLNGTARGHIDLGKIRRHWADILRLAGSIHTGSVSAFDAMRTLQHAGQPTQLGDALAHYGRIFKTLHVLAYVEGPDYRRDIKSIRNLQEGRHGLARHVFHGRRGELHRAYTEGMEDQLGALGLVLNCITLWNTIYLDTAITRLRADGYPVQEQDLARLSPYSHGHINVHGHYSFQLPDLARGGGRPLRDPERDE